MNNTRNRIFYLKSQITEGLYTPGKQYVDDLGKEYIGQYHKYIDGLVMSGTTYTNSSTRLYPFQENATIYEQLTNINKTDYVAPYYFPPRLTEKDYETGYIKRYFLQRRNSIMEIVEVDEKQYKMWRKIGSGIDEKLYNGIEINWKLTGSAYTVFENKIKTEGVFDINKNTIHEAVKTLHGLTSYITDYLEFYKTNVL